MKMVYLTHSLQSCWNHGNAHFLRGVLREWTARGHDAVAWEPRDAWSRANLVRDAGEAGLEPFRRAFPGLSSRRYEGLEVLERLADADLVIVHEWNDPAVVAAVGEARRRGARFTLLFHDTHHRAVSDPDGIRAFDLSGYDGVLAFGEALAEVYRREGWGRRVFVWHEAADVRLFHPPAIESRREGLIWIGNWGDGERSSELEAFLLAPAHAADLELDVHGVRYPPEALDMLARHGARYQGWLANAAAPAAFARRMATVHVPRRFYVEQLPGIPTIRVFEALACGIPLISAPWSDSEGLFRTETDFLMVQDGDAMTAALRALKADPDLRDALAAAGRETILKRHTCAHRVDELLGVLASLGVRTAPRPEGVPA